MPSLFPPTPFIPTPSPDMAAAVAAIASSPPAYLATLRPHLPRQRSNSLPLIEALGCSSAEASILLAEGTTASVRRRGTTWRSNHRRTATYTPPLSTPSPAASVSACLTPAAVAEAVMALRPQHHARYLDPAYYTQSQHQHHLLPPTPSTFTSTSTPSLCSDATATSPASAASAYSAQLAQFTKARLASIPSCPKSDLLLSPTRTDPSCLLPAVGVSSPLSPSAHARTDSSLSASRRPAASDLPPLGDLPPPRPPLRSAFSAWSSTDGGDADADASSDADADVDTPALIRYVRGPGSFLLSTTPPASEYGDSDGTAADSNAAPVEAAAGASASGTPRSPFTTLHLTPPPANSPPPSPASSLTLAPASYFDHKRSPHHVPRLGLTSPLSQQRGGDQRAAKLLAALSPLEGAGTTLSPHMVHAVLVQSPTRVVVEGLAFDLVREMHLGGTPF